MKAHELWKKSGLRGEYQAWQFGADPDKLADLVRKGIKTATCSSYELYLKTGEPIPKTGDYSIVLDSKDEAVCIIRNTKVYIEEFDKISAEHAYKEGEGDRSLEYWRKVHIDFLTSELASIDMEFDEHTRLVCEEFELVYVPDKQEGEIWK